MQLITRHLIAGAFNNAWANHRLLTACGQLSQEEFVAKRVSFFPSIRLTLNHILAVDAYYMDAIQRSLRGESPHNDPGSFFTDEEPHARCDELTLAQKTSDGELIALCRSIADDETLLERVVQVPRTETVDPEPMHRLLHHMFEHQTHHRGQVHAMLSGTSVAPPQLDEFYCANDATRRAADFLALGFTESDVWL